MPKSLFFCIFAQNIKYKKIIGKEENMIVGRKEEIAELDKLYYSDRPEFVAIYGRRRVGKDIPYQTSTERSHHLSAYRRVAC